MDIKPVNKIETITNTLKVADFNTPIQLKILDENNELIDLTDNITHFFITKDDYKFYEVTDFTFKNKILYFKMPNVRKGRYKIEIKDGQGSIYPAQNNIYIDLIQSFDGRKESAYTTIKDDIINRVKPIVIEHIESNREFYRGEKGDKGERGLQGLKGEKGDKGEKGERGQQGLKGEQGDQGEKGEQGLKGEKGEKGDQGERGLQGLKGEKGERGLQGLKGEKGDQGERGLQGLKGEKGDQGERGEDFNPEKYKIGSTNLISLMDLELYDKGTIENIDLINGIIQIKDANWLLQQKNVYLKNRKYVFSLKDIDKIERSNNTLSLNVMSGNSSVKYVLVQKGKYGILDMTGVDEGYYDLRIYFASSNIISGLNNIEKPMLIEGDIPVLWDMSEKDRSIYLESLKKSNYHLATIPNQNITGTLSNPNIVEIVNSSSDSTQNTTQNKITLSQGIWLVNINTFCSPINYEGIISFHLFLNENIILLSQLLSKDSKNKSFSYIFKVNDTSQFYLGVSKTSDNNSVGFNDTNQNKITLTKIGVI